ncbi:MAG: peptidoglycan DD-metalloendopeptidase family protein [Myxococcales bacterium]|nr:peptidoglycan DD-metalloendopeptidase family protein [Myxococcales bacterium]
MRPLGLLGAGALLAVSVALIAPGYGVSATKASKRDVAAAARYTEHLQRERESLAKTQGLLTEKLEIREGEMKRRLRAIYKLSRANWPRVWFEPEARRESARWLGAARRVAMRDVREIDMLHHEIDLADKADTRLIEESTLEPAASPKQRTLQWPILESKIVRGYGEYKGPSHRVKLRSRGVRLASEAGRGVSPVATGRVRYVGPIRGLGTSLIIEHGDLVSITGDVENPTVRAGDPVKRGQELAVASGDSIYLELRLVVGQRGQSIDPEPLLVAPL